MPLVALGRNTKTEKDITISSEERLSGLHVLGATGTGKSTLLTNVFLQDIQNGHGGLFVDVDGDNIDQLLVRIPQNRMEDVILLDLSDTKRSLGLNPLAGLKTSRDADRLMQIFKMLWNIGPETPRLENILRGSLLTLVYNGLTIAEMPYLLRNEAFRKRCVAHIFSLFADEWQLYVTPDFNELLTRGRKYGIGATLANQTLSQLDTELQRITEQLNIYVTFRVGAKDADSLAPYYTRDVQPENEEREKVIISPTPIDTILSRSPHEQTSVTQAFYPWREMVKEAHAGIHEGRRAGTRTEPFVNTFAMLAISPNASKRTDKLDASSKM